jgi:hypothetical protein
MAASATITLNGQITGIPDGSTRTFGPLTITSGAANWQTQAVVLGSGANTITVPTNPAPTGCLIVLPSGNAVVTTLKGVSGDTGIAIGKTTALLLCWDSTAVPASFVLTSASAQSNPTQISFF